MTTESMNHPNGEKVADIRTTQCCIVGGGPAGVMLALLLARKGVNVILLEAHKDFDRDFRGDTLHPSTLDVLDQLGLADAVLQIPHGLVRQYHVVTAGGQVPLANFGRLRTRFPFIAMLPQAKFLDFLCSEAQRFPNFQLVLGANVQRLVYEGEKIIGVRYRGEDDQWHQVQAALTVAADGRFSKIRNLLDLEPDRSAPPMDVVWFRLPRRSQDDHDVGALYIRDGHLAVVIERQDEWQIGFVILKGSYSQLHAAGLSDLRQKMAALVPWLADRVEVLTDWKQVSVLSVESSRLKTWYAPGVLLIGDAAHVISPVGGVGINYAIQDAVATANLLAEPLRRGEVSLDKIAAVQKRREWPTKVIQRFQGVMQKQIAAPALQTGQPFQLPPWIRFLLRLPYFRNLPARMFAYGVRPERVQ